MHWYTSQEDDIRPEMARSYSRVLDHAAATDLADRHGARWRCVDQQQTAYTWFSNQGTFEWIFLEDARSFGARLPLIDEYGLRGFSVWVLGSEDPEIWSVLRQRRR